MWEKVKEETREFEDELRKAAPEGVKLTGEGREKAEAEFGDLLFALVNAGRLYKLRPDNALEKTDGKFMRRFNYIERRATAQGRHLKDMSLGEMEALWQEAKKME